jgi:hypothetical protein
VDAEAFTASLQSWHDFYLAVASAAAALLGLLFVGVSIRLATLRGPRRAEVRDLANLAFSNLLYLLGLSLVVLIPTTDPSVVIISFAVIALLGLLRAGRRAIPLVRPEGRLHDRWPALRRLGWTVVADLLLLYVAASLASSEDPRWLLATPIVVGVLLLGAADVAWDLLVSESEDGVPTPPAAVGTSPADPVADSSSPNKTGPTGDVQRRRSDGNDPGP